MKFSARILYSLLLAADSAAQSEMACPLDVKPCPGGQTLNRNHTNGCKFDLCQGENDCSEASAGNEENWLMCPSGTKSYCDGFNNCEFKPCDDPACLLTDYNQCPSSNLHVWTARNPRAGSSGCQEHLPCPGSGTPENLPSGTSESGPSTLSDTGNSGSGNLVAPVGIMSSIVAAAVFSMAM